MHVFRTPRWTIPDYLLGIDGLRAELESDASLDALEQGWRPGLDAFAERRRAYLLYPEG